MIRLLPFAEVGGLIFDDNAGIGSGHHESANIEVKRFGFNDFGMGEVKRHLDIGRLEQLLAIGTCGDDDSLGRVGLRFCGDACDFVADAHKASNCRNIVMTTEASEGLIVGSDH